MTNATPPARSALALFAAMALFLPWPFYELVAFTLSSIPAMIGTQLWGAGRAALSASPLALFLITLPVLALTLVQAAVGLFLFHRLARRLALVIARSPQPRAALGVALALIFAASWLPVFGGGGNFARGVPLHNLYGDYAQVAGATGRRAGPPAPTAHPATLEGTGFPAMVIRPTPPVPMTGEAAMPSIGASAPIAGRPMRAITVEQGQCLRNGGTPRACLGPDTP